MWLCVFCVYLAHVHVWASENDVHERINRNILGKLTENKAKRECDDDDMTQHDRCKYSKMEYCIMSQELLRETKKTIYIYVCGWADMRWLRNTFAVDRILHSTVHYSECVFSMENLHCAFFSFFFFPVCINSDLEKEHVLRCMLRIQYFEWQGIRSLVRNKVEEAHRCEAYRVWGMKWLKKSVGEMQ